MEEKSIWQAYRELLKTIAGNWHAEAIDQTLIFSSCDKPSREGNLITIDKNKKTSETVYSVGSYLGDNIESISFIEIGLNWDTKRWYKIKEITPAKMLLIEIEKAAGRKEISREFLYIRTTGLNSADETLKELS